MLKRRVLEAVRARERVLRLEYRLLHRDGSARWVADRRQMIYGEDGRLRWVDGLILDITDRKRSDVTLRLTQFTVDREAKPPTGWVGTAASSTSTTGRARRSGIRGRLLSMKIQEINPDFPRAVAVSLGRVAQAANLLGRIDAPREGRPSHPRGDHGELHRVRREGVQLRLRPRHHRSEAGRGGEPAAPGPS